jgi:hypothetical protein
MANVVASTHRQAPLDHGLLNIGEPLRPLELRTRPLHVIFGRRPILRWTSSLSKNGARPARTASLTAGQPAGIGPPNLLRYAIRGHVGVCHRRRRARRTFSTHAGVRGSQTLMSGSTCARVVSALRSQLFRVSGSVPSLHRISRSSEGGLGSVQSSRNRTPLWASV